MVVGVAGKYCAGKNSVIFPLEKMGFYHVDVDRLGHSALLNQREKLIETFGKGIDKGDGTIDRKALGAIVFADPAEKRKLEGIVHPEMIRMTEKIIEEKKNVIVNAAILFEMKLDRLCDLVFWVDAPAIIRFFRGIKRDNLPAKEVLKRIRAQSNMNPKKYKSSADIIIIRNVGSREKTAVKIENILKKRM